MKKTVLWYFLLKKRLLKRVSFILILLSIPLLTLLFTLSVRSEETGFLRIALAAEDPTDPIAAQAIRRLQAESEVLLFTDHPTPQAAKDQVYSGKADAAWIFSEGLAQKLEQYAKGEYAPSVTVYETENNSLLSLAREKIYGTLLEEIAYTIYTDYAAETFNDPALTPDRLQEIYEQTAIKGELIRFEFADTDRAVEELHYLTTPLRGLLAVVMLLCGMAATLYFLTDEQHGTFAWLAASKRFWVLWGENLAALSLAGTVTTLALLFSGNFTEPLWELMLMTAYVFAAAGFCTALGAVQTTTRFFALLFPTVTVASTVFSPVFYNLRTLPLIQRLFPPYHYLYAIDDPAFFGSLLIYIPLALAVGYGLYRITRRNL